MSKINTKKDLGLKAKEALTLIEDSLKEEGFDEEVVRDFLKLVVHDTKWKATIHEKDIFKEKLKELIKEYEWQLKKKDYRSLYKQLLGLFQDEKKIKMRRLWDSWSYGINCTILGAILLFFVLIELRIL